ncbi:Melibiose operon regulatory protein [compost metagenome]
MMEIKSNADAIKSQELDVSNKTDVIASIPLSNSLDSATLSPLSVYSKNQHISIELRQPLPMSCYHWHGQIEINLPFDSGVEYLINGEVVKLKKNHIGLFWACVPHKLTEPGDCKSMAILYLPMHLFLSWPVDRELITCITHGMVVKSCTEHIISESEVKRWQLELASDNGQIRQLATDEIGLMLKRLSLLGWEKVSISRSTKTTDNLVSKHAQVYVSQMLAYISSNYDQALTIANIAEHVKLNPNYAMGIFHRVMQLTMKQYITTMRLNHVRALLGDTDKSVLDIALTAGFRSSSRFYSTFQKHIGMTPQKYRNLSKSNHVNSSSE